MNYHLVILAHGVWGNPLHMNYLAEQVGLLKPTDPNEQLVIHKTGSHSGYLTYDGVDVNGKRLADEIVAQAELIGNVTKISIIGYSMGGLMCRYAIGILHHSGFFDKVEPVNFVTFCTPHVGTVNASASLLSRIFNFVAPYVLALTGAQFWLKDKGYNGMPLLVWMANPELKFFKGLASFRNKALYANTINDRRTSWYTTFISRVDPFQLMVNALLSAYNMLYVDSYEPTVIDFNKPITFSPVPKPEKTKRLTVKKFAYKTLVWLKLMARFVVFAPAYALYSLGNAVVQRIRLVFRLRLFRRDLARSLSVLYEEPTKESYIEEKVNDQTDMFIENIFGAVNSASYYDYHHSVRPKDVEKQALKPQLVNLKGKEITGFKLSFNAAQEAIVANLNKLEWRKFPVIIRNTKATHAAVIYRHPDPAFAEGKVVVRHFTEQVFQC